MSSQFRSIKNNVLISFELAPMNFKVWTYHIYRNDALFDIDCGKEDVWSLRRISCVCVCVCVHVYICMWRCVCMHSYTHTYRYIKRTRKSWLLNDFVPIKMIRKLPVTVRHYSTKRHLFPVFQEPLPKPLIITMHT